MTSTFNTIAAHDETFTSYEYRNAETVLHQANCAFADRKDIPSLVDVFCYELQSALTRSGDGNFSVLKSPETLACISFLEIVTALANANRRRIPNLQVRTAGLD